MTSDKELPLEVWLAYFSLVVIGMVVGLLSGAGFISGIGLVIVIFGSLTGFIPWAIWKLEPETLSPGEGHGDKRDEE